MEYILSAIPWREWGRILNDMPCFPIESMCICYRNGSSNHCDPDLGTWCRGKHQPVVRLLACACVSHKLGVRMESGNENAGGVLNVEIDSTWHVRLCGPGRRHRKHGDAFPGVLGGIKVDFAIEEGDFNANCIEILVQVYGLPLRFYYCQQMEASCISLIQIKKPRLAELRAEGIEPYPQYCCIQCHLAGLGTIGDRSKEDLQSEATFSIAGRMMLKRGKGKWICHDSRSLWNHPNLCSKRMTLERLVLHFGKQHRWAIGFVLKAVVNVLRWARRPFK